MHLFIDESKSGFFQKQKESYSLKIQQELLIFESLFEEVFKNYSDYVFLKTEISLYAICFFLRKANELELIKIEKKLLKTVNSVVHSHCCGVKKVEKCILIKSDHDINKNREFTEIDTKFILSIKKILK